MDAYTQPVLDSAYQQQFADLTDHAGVQEVVNKRTAALTATEETYGTTDKETIYCGSGRTGICIDGSDTIEIEKKAPTASDVSSAPRWKRRLSQKLTSTTFLQCW